MRLANVSITAIALLLMLTLLAGCGTQAAPSACAWLKPIQPNPGFQHRWTRDEKNQVDAFDRAVDATCGMSPDR